MKNVVFLDVFHKIDRLQKKKEKEGKDNWILEQTGNRFSISGAPKTFLFDALLSQCSEDKLQIN